MPRINRHSKSVSRAMAPKASSTEISSLADRTLKRRFAFRKRLLFSAALAFAADSASTVCAQVAAGPGQARPQGGSGLSEIVVTAQRKTESAQKAAIPIDVISTASLKQAGVVTATTLNAAAPSLIVTKAGGANTSFYVRGVGNFTSNAYADPSIAFNVDGVYLGRPTSTTGTFFDLDRVEILKGPQGTLYGRNATGGAINVIPTKPKIGENSGYLSLGYGSFRAVDGEAAVNVALGGSTAFRLSGKVVHDKGYNADGTNDEVGHAIRAQVLTVVSPSLRVRIAGDYSHQGGNGPGASYNGVYGFAPGAPPAAQAIPAYIYTPAPAGLGPYAGLLSPAARAYQSGFVIGGTFNNPSPLSRPYVDNDYWGVNEEINLDSPIGKFTLIPAYRESKLHVNFNGPSFLGGLVAEKDKQFSSELRLEGMPAGPLEWLLGAYYFDESIRSKYTFSQYIVNVYQDLSVGTKSYAGFGRAVFHVGDRFRLIAGGRYTNDDKRFDVVGDTTFNICTTPPPSGAGCFGGPSVPLATSLADLNRLGAGQFSPLFPGAPAVIVPNGPPVHFGTAGNIAFDNRLVAAPRAAFNRFTYKLGAEFDVGPASLLYLTYETGYHSGGFSVSQSHPTFQPEYITALTLGSKNRFFDNKAQFNVELFRWKYRNQQVSHFGFEADGSTNFFTENLGRSTISGVDADLQFKATPTTLLHGSVQYLHNKIDSFVFYLPFGGTNLPPVVGCPYAGNVAVGATLNYRIDCSGQAGYNSPEWSINSGIEKTVYLDQLKLVMRGDVRYRSSRITGFERLAQQNSGADTTVDLSATLGDRNDRRTLTGYIRNLTDAHAAVATQYSGSTGGSVSTIYAQPRAFGLRASVKY